MKKRKLFDSEMNFKTFFEQVNMFLRIVTQTIDVGTNGLMFASIKQYVFL